MLFHTVSFYKLINCLLLLGWQPRASLHTGIFDAFRGYGEAVLVHLAAEEVCRARSGDVVEGLSGCGDYFHELPSRHILRDEQGTHGAYVSVGGRGHFVGDDAVGGRRHL